MTLNMRDTFTITGKCDTMTVSERALLLQELRAWQATERTVKQSITRLQKRLAEIEAQTCECERLEMMA